MIYYPKSILYKFSVCIKSMIKVPYPDAEKVFNELVQNKTKCIVLFTGEANNDGTNWCPDCQNIYPLYPKFL